MLMIPALLLACADVTPVEKNQRLGEAVVLKDWFTSALLVRSGDAIVLFDGGFRAGTLRRRLEDEGVSPDELTHVFVTHGHPDHLALLPEVQAPIHALEAEHALIHEELDGPELVALVDGEQVPVGDTVVEVFSVPGHTDGSAVYLIDGLLVLGDTSLQDRDGNLVPVADRRSDDPAQNLDSVRALADRLEPRRDEIIWLVPAHSAPLEGFAPLAGF